jgi:4a-hydroxytetrahydrobiopterin dehydratase
MTGSDTQPLKTMSCKPCEGGVDPLPEQEAQRMLKDVPGWNLDDQGERILRSWTVRDFQSGIDFLNRVAQIAEQEQHHPDLHLTGYKQVKIELWTHAIGGLSINDFILAAKINDVPVAVKK